ncbi:MAG: Hpt domain-containing protein [Geitlerinemataceae cyanobacterium]
MASEEIVRFFIEEGKEHLNTLERGLLDLKASMKDQEMVNEMFRAAHSVKGGAAMLGFSSIQKTAHRLEDYFKILKDNTGISVDQKLETLFLKGLDTLRELLEMLQGPFGLQEEEANAILKDAEPSFDRLQAYLEELQGNGGTSEEELPSDFSTQVVDLLKQMLQLFKQSESQNSRQKLGSLCQYLSELGGESPGWQQLVETARLAIVNSSNPYRILAPFVIKEIKQASEALTIDSQANISPSRSLKQLTQIENGAWSNHVVISLDPKTAARTLLKVMDKPQLVKLAKILYKAAQ